MVDGTILPNDAVAQSEEEYVRADSRMLTPQTTGGRHGVLASVDASRSWGLWGPGSRTLPD